MPRLVKWSLTFASVSLTVAAIPAQEQTPVTPHPIGTLQNGVHHHKRTGIELTLPPEWVIVNQAPASTPGAQYIKLKNSVSNALATVWIKRRTAEPPTFRLS